jgi:hypothetical protein
MYVYKRFLYWGRSIGKFREFHDPKKDLGNLFKSETDASKLSAGSQVQKNQTSSCWSFFRLSSNPKLKEY